MRSFRPFLTDIPTDILFIHLLFLIFMYHKAYGIIETLAPLHVGASAGEETGNLNLIFRDQFTQTGIIPGSSIRGRFRADMRINEPGAQNKWYGHEVVAGREDGGTTEALVKFEYASLVWLPVFCPGQPIVWVTCPWLLRRYQQIVRPDKLDSKDTPLPELPKPYTAAKTIQGRTIDSANNNKVLFFNLGFLTIDHLVEEEEMKPWIPSGNDLEPANLVVVDNNDISMLHDMALYRQSRVALGTDESFRSYFELPNDTDEVIAEFGYALKQVRLQLPKTDRSLPGLSELQQQLEETLPYVRLTSEVAKREILVAPILTRVAVLSQQVLRIEYPLKVNHQLKAIWIT